jgi:MFS family permease
MPQAASALLIACLPLTALATLQFVMPVLAPLLTDAAGLTPEAYGWLGGAMGLGSVWFYVVNGTITPALGPLRTLRGGLLVAIIGLALVLTAWWPAMIVGCILIGFGYATTTPAGSQILADFAPRTMWGTLFSIRQAGVPAGGIAAGAIGTFLVAHIGWRGAIEVVMGLLLVVAMGLLLVPRRYNETRPLVPFAPAELVDPSSIARPFLVVRATAGLPSLVGVGIGLGFVHATVTSFFVLYLNVDLGVPLPAAASLFAILQAFAIAGRIGFGLLADRIGSPLPVLKLLAPLSAASALMLSYVSADWSGGGLVLAAIVIGLTVGTWNGLYLAEVARLAPAHSVSEVTASAGFFGFFAYMIAPPLVGWLAITAGYEATFRIVALAPVAAFVILLARDRAPKRP